MWFAKSSELYRQSNSYLFIRATCGLQNIVLWYAKHVHAVVQKTYFSFSLLLLLHYSTQLSLQLSSLTVLSAHRVCVLWNSSIATCMILAPYGIL